MHSDFLTEELIKYFLVVVPGYRISMMKSINFGMGNSLGWLRNISSLVLFNHIKILVQVDFDGLVNLGLVNQLPSKIKDRENHDHQVSIQVSSSSCVSNWWNLREQEIGDLPVSVKRQENSVSTNESHDECPSTGIVRRPGHEPSSVRKRLSIDPLSLQSAVEADIRHTTAAVIDEL